MQLEIENGLLLVFEDKYAVGVIAGFNNHCAVVDACTHSSVIACSAQQSTATVASHEYTSKVRHGCTDNHSANTLGEEKIREACSSGFNMWQCLHFLCEVHIVFSIHRSFYNLMSFDCQGILRHALSVRIGNSMALFRRHCG